MGAIDELHIARNGNSLDPPRKKSVVGLVSERPTVGTGRTHHQEPFLACVTRFRQYRLNINAGMMPARCRTVNVWLLFRWC